MTTYTPIVKNFNYVIKSSTTFPFILTPTPVAPTKLGISLEKMTLLKTLVGADLELQLYDLPETAFPESLNSKFYTEFEKNLVLRDNEWNNSNKITLEVLWRETPLSTWQVRGSISLLNRGNVPYSHPGFLRACKPVAGTITLSGEEQLAIRLINSGYGLLRLNDKLVVTFLYQENVQTDDISPYVSPDNLMWMVPPEGIKLITLPNNVAWVRYYNNGTQRIWVNWGILDGVGYGDAILPGESKMIVNPLADSFRYSGDLWAICEGNSSQPMSGVLATY